MSSPPAASKTGGEGPVPGTMNWEPIRKRLLGSELKDALVAATELREEIAIVHTTEYPLMLNALLPAFSAILGHRTSPTADTTSLHHKLRNAVLEIISRMPSNEILRPHAPHLVALAIDILNRDYEDNALLASRIIFDLHKVYRLPQDYVQPYLDFVQGSYRMLPSIVQRNFAFPPPLPIAPSPITQQNNATTSNEAANSTPEGNDKRGVDPSEEASASSISTSISTPNPLPSNVKGGAATATAPSTSPIVPTQTSSFIPPKTYTTSPGSPSSQASALTSISPRSRLALRSNVSFRVLTEHPLIVMLMFQLYPKFLKSNIPVLINVMMEALSLRAPPPQSFTSSNSTVDPQSKRLYFSRARELVAAQAKTLSFLTYLLRGFSSELKPYEERLASNVVALMSTCPRESISTRKELLVATRHLLNSEFRTGFFRHVDNLLDERVLMGYNHRYSEQTILRPLAYTALSDLVHHVKARLTMSQMSKVVCMFSRILHDSSVSLPLSTQYTAVRTLLSVVEIIFQNKDSNPQIGRDMLVRILSTLVNKLATLNEYFAAIQKKAEDSQNGSHAGNEDLHSLLSSEVMALNLGTSAGTFVDEHHHLSTSFISDRGDGRDRSNMLDGNVDVLDSLKDLRSMIRAIVVGHKTVIWYINNYRSQREKDTTRESAATITGSNEEVFSALLKMTNSERALIDKYITIAIPCIQFLKEEPRSESGTPNSSLSKLPATDQYRDVLSYFAAAFTTLDGFDLKRTLGRRLDILVEAIVDDSTVMVVPRHLLGANATTSYEFCAILLRFLVERMDDLSVSKCTDIRFFGPALGSDLKEVEKVNPLLDEALHPREESIEKAERRATTYLQLFERVLKSLSVYPDNECALRPHLRRIVSTCLRSSMENADQWPDNYCMLLRYVFRSVSAGKFEESYKELLPLIAAALNGLYRVIVASKSSRIRNTVIELCLTIPARLSSLLPHMNLLLRVIVLALESVSGDLVNLGLRTLEFWVDNLNPDFLYPELSKQMALFSKLMQALSLHLRPAPYPYGLLSLRLLGKLGGRNRRFLREGLEIDSDVQDSNDHCSKVRCKWLSPTIDQASDNASTATGLRNNDFSLPLPLERCVEILKQLAATEIQGGTRRMSQEQADIVAETGASGEQTVLPCKDRFGLWDKNVEDIDFQSYCSDITARTRQSQAKSAFTVVRTAIATTIAPAWDINSESEVLSELMDYTSENMEMDDESISFHQLQSRNKHFLNVCLGVMYSALLESTKVEATSILNGLATFMYCLVIGYHRDLKRIDANGAQIYDDLEITSSPKGKQQNATESGSSGLGSFVEYEKLGSLKPFGYFHCVGALRKKVNPLLFNKALATFLAEAAPSSEAGLSIIRAFVVHAKAGDFEKGAAERDSSPLGRGSQVFFENLLSNLCVGCFAHEWNQRDGLLEGICILLDELGRSWGFKYECEIMNVAFFVVKSVPRELSTAVIKGFRFFVRLSCALYDRPPLMGGKGNVIWDALAVCGEKDAKDEAKVSPLENNGKSCKSPCSAVLRVAFNELASPKQICRIAARFLLKHFVTSRTLDESKKAIQAQMPLIRRVIFSRSLRLLPLAEQVGAIEALAFLVREAPSVLPLPDQHLLAFLSELLKMCSVADGEMSDSALSSYVVDKNGNATLTHEANQQGIAAPEKHPSHSSAIFFRRECILHVSPVKMVVPEELPHGVQLRVSSISLLHLVIVGHPDPFFDAESSTPIGNIRPHVISLLFRSLVSNPLTAVVTAHEALREVLSLSVASKDSKESRSQSRLPKELLQTCIRPVLLNLREYTRLSVPLLRGLSRLLSLLSSWFNRTLGEKLLDHLQKWTEPALIKSHKKWSLGEEPFVAAAIIDLFSLLPHASHFVEPLVKTTIKLEAYLPGFNAHCVTSPYRRPLARYLNKHCQYTVGFFFQRLKAPIYSELFQHIIRLKESAALCEYLSGKQSSVMMLNVCFERPLAIIRSEKTSSSGTSPSAKSSGKSSSSDLFLLHGIHTIQPESLPISRETSVKHEMEAKKKQLVVLQQEAAKSEAVLQKATGSAKEKAAREEHNLAQIALEKGTKDLSEARHRYSAEIALAGRKPEVTSTSGTSPRPMKTEQLELQHQGFLLVEALTTNNENYLKDHNDVVRAFRWLWRSKGRYLRLQHEDGVAPRYHEESKVLVTFLMNYAKAFPSDVDVLFELSRIFLQPATTDFSFVRVFLAETAQNLKMSQKKQVMQRFFVLMAGESTEETKALSIQLLIYPLLSSTRTQCKTDQEKETEPHKQESQEVASGSNPSQGSDEAVIDQNTIKKFAYEVLAIECGDKLKVELLRMSNSLLEHFPQESAEFQKDFLRFCWSLIKSEDALCKAWAYLVVCQLISLFQIQAKYVLQVYAALLRSHHQEGKSLVRAALSLLVPALSKRLSDSDFKKSIDMTSRIMFEDGSVPQLAHIWHLIVVNEVIFYPYRNKFVRYMVNSLNRLGLPPNSPLENRVLAVSMISMLVEWDSRQEDESQKVDGSSPAILKRKCSYEGAPNAKKSRGNQGTAIPVLITDEENVLLDRSMAETMANFLVRLKVLLADPKVESGGLDVDYRLMDIFRSVISKWEYSVIRPIYFEKVVSLCKEEGAADPKGGHRGANNTTKSSRSASSVSQDGKKNESRLVTSTMLSACLDIFIALSTDAPKNPFLRDNPDHVKAILGSCFRHISQSESLQGKLRKFIVGLYSDSVRPVPVSEDVLLSINASLDRLIVDATRKAAVVTPTASSKVRDRIDPTESKDEDSHTVQFLLHIVEDVGKHRSDYLRTFSSSLLALGSHLVKKHTADAIAKQRQGSSGASQQSGFVGVPQVSPTPTVGILDEGCADNPAFGISSVVAKSQSIKPNKDFVPAGSPIRSLVIILRLLGGSDVIFTFSEDRKMLLYVLSSILDSSDSVPLLMAAVKVVGNWLREAKGALTCKERASFLLKISSFDYFSPASDVESQPIMDLVANYVIKLVERTLELHRNPAQSLGVYEAREAERVAECDRKMLDRSLVACLLTPNTDVRYKLLSLYARRRSKNAGMNSLQRNPSMTDDNEDHTMEPQTAVAALMQLLQSDYEGLGSRCWLVVFVDLLLESSVSDIELQSAGKNTVCMGSWLPELRWNAAASSRSDSVSKLDFERFCKALPRSPRGQFECLRALQNLAHGDVRVCISLFSALFPAAWNQVPNDLARLRLASAMESLLSRPFHSQLFRPSMFYQDGQLSNNAVKMFVNSLLAINPKPLLDTSLLVFTAENYNCWFEVLTVLEQQHLALTKDAAVQGADELIENTLSAMRHCYRQLGEKDVWISLASESCALPETKDALILELYGMAKDASDAYSQLVDRYQRDEGESLNASNFELSLWEDHWIKLQRELCQQEVVSEFAALSTNPRLMLEAAWKSQNWDQVRQLLVSPPLVARVESGDPTIKMCETLLAVADGKLGDVENSHAQAAQLCLYKWQQLPQLSRGSNCHAGLLHGFHRLVEIRESGQIMVETNNHSSGRTLPDLKNLLSAWRHRLPNDYEEMTTWDDIIVWRAHMFNAITKNFQFCEPGALAALHDRPWTAIRIAKTARKQGTRDVALLLLNKLTDNRSMDVGDAFLKLREQILAYDNPGSELERTGGLNLINTTNLNFFDAPQKSELFRLKALFLASLGLRSKSNQAFCHSVQICPSHARAWVSWGGLCSSLGALTEKQMEQNAAKSGTEPSKETRANTAKKVAQYLAQSMGCYFEAITINSREWSRIHLPKCLMMLTKDGSSPGVLCQTMENRGGALPPWVWLPWIPQLLSCLCRTEGRAVKAILVKLVKSYPQAIYYSLRAFYLERRDVERAKGSTSTPSVHMPSVSYAEEMMSTLRRSHASLWSSLEAILEELIVKFRPSYEEELLATITALIERADSQPGSSVGNDKRSDGPDAMVTSVSKTLGRIAVKFFRSSAENSTSRNDERARKTAEFKMRYKSKFEADFKVSSTEKEQTDKNPQISLPEYLVLLKRWRKKLEGQVASTPLSLPLMESSQSLSIYACDAPELWPGACDPRSLSSAQPDRAPISFETENRTSQSSTSSSSAAAHKAASNAATAAATAASKEGIGGDYGGGSSVIEIPGFYAPNTCSTSDLRPDPELHAKLVKFEPTVQVLRREQLVRRIGMVGSDGRVYRFLLQFAIPYWTRTDERVAQTHFALDMILRKDLMCSRKHLSVQPTAVIPVAQRLRMTADASSRIALDEVYKRHCERMQEELDNLTTFYNQELTKACEDESKEATAMRVDVFRKVVEKTDCTILLRHIAAALGSPEGFFQFRRSFTDQLAANSLLQYAWSVTERTPARVVFSQTTGQVQSPDFRVTYNSQGFIESRILPFRMTQNLKALIGSPMLSSHFVSSFAIVADAVKKSKEEMDPILRLLMRDDIVAWYCKSMAKSDSKLQELEKQLADRVTKNVSYLQARFSECAPKKTDAEKKGVNSPIDKKVRDLIAAASDPGKICMLPTNYQGWL